MNIEGLIAVGGSFILGIGVVATAIKKWMPKVAAYTHVAADSITLCSVLEKALEPDPVTGKIELTDAELAAFKAALLEVKAAFDEAKKI